MYCTVQAKVDLKTFTKTERLPCLTVTTRSWLLLTLEVCGDWEREGEKMLEGGRRRPRWSTSSKVSVFIKAGMEEPDVI